MLTKVGAATAAGLVAGVVFGLMMQLTTVPAPDGGRMSMLAMVGAIVGSPTIGAGWLYHLFNSAVIGAIFGLVLGRRVYSYGSGLGWGAAYGVTWWILGGLLLMPLMLGMAPFAPLMMPEMWGAAVGSFFGHLVYGLILGAGYVWLRLHSAYDAPVRS